MKKGFVITAGLVILSCLSAYGVTLDKVAVLSDHRKPVNYVTFSKYGKEMVYNFEMKMKDAASGSQIYS